MTTRKHCDTCDAPLQEDGILAGYSVDKSGDYEIRAVEFDLDGLTLEIALHSSPKGKVTDSQEFCFRCLKRAVTKAFKPQPKVDQKLEPQVVEVSPRKPVAKEQVRESEPELEPEVEDDLEPEYRDEDVADQAAKFLRSQQTAEERRERVRGRRSNSP